MKEIIRGYYKGERPLFHEHDLKIVDTIFDEGESPLKESRDIELYGSMFKWKYHKLDVRDAAHIARLLAQRKADKLPKNADFNGDGKVDVRDAAAIAKFLAKSHKKN